MTNIRTYLPTIRFFVAQRFIENMSGDLLQMKEICFCVSVSTFIILKESIPFIFYTSYTSFWKVCYILISVPHFTLRIRSKWYVWITETCPIVALLLDQRLITEWSMICFKVILRFSRNYIFFFSQSDHEHVQLLRRLYNESCVVTWTFWAVYVEANKLH